MRTADDQPVGPEIGAALAAIDTTLAGEPVDPSHAELAELALILAAERPQPTPAFTSALDRRVAARFAGEGRHGSGGWWPGRRWLFAPAAGLAAVMAVAVVVVLGASGSGPVGSSALNATASATHAAGSTAAGSAGSTVARAAVPAEKLAPSTFGSATTPGSGGSAASSRSSSVAAGTPLAPGTLGAGGQNAPAPVPTPNGRKIVQSAQLALNAPANRIDDVAQQVFDVVGTEQGIVNRSTVTATGNPAGYAEFELSVPSASLSDAMTALSRLRYASVVSRTDATQDVNGQFNAASRRLADARALRTSLLKQLAAAVTQTQIDSLTAQIHDAEASISSDQAALGRLNHQINYSQITLTINAVSPAPAPVAGGSSFTIGRAAHDAGRVLTVAAGVALIALAALVPLALLGAVAWWLGLSVRRRRRQQALDLA